VDLNCGCPQKWAIQERIGSALLETPELIKDMVRSVSNGVFFEYIRRRTSFAHGGQSKNKWNWLMGREWVPVLH
jgi:hypothetical protein